MREIGKKIEIFKPNFRGNLFSEELMRFEKRIVEN
jgi:hypothetical protein